MNYTTNEDRIFSERPTKAAFNAVVDVLFIEDSGFTEPVTVAEALQLANIDDLGQDNSLIEVLITTARQQCEAYTNIGFIRRQIQAVVNNSIGGVSLPYGPVAEVIRVEDADGAEQEYTARGVQFMTLQKPVSDYLKITYNAGYSELHQVFKTAILQQVAYLYRHRGDEDKVGTLSPLVKSLLKPHRRVW